MVNKVINIDVNGHKVVFLCYFRNTRSGFAHDAELFIDGFRYGDATCHYLNRTWERWNFESVCLSVCSSAIERRMATMKDNYKETHGISRLVGEHKEVYELRVKSDDTINLLKAIKEDLSKNSY